MFTVPNERYIRELGDEEFKRIQNNFVYHAPQESQVRRYELIRTLFRLQAVTLSRMVPPSRELSLALTKLEESCFWFNAAIARNQHVEEAIKNASAGPDIRPDPIQHPDEIRKG